MHVLFRVLGQQSGLQLVRGILPEAIDAYINTAIYQKVRTELLSGTIVGLENTANRDGTAMDSVNLYRSLFHRVEYHLNSATPNHLNVITKNDNKGNITIVVPTKAVKDNNLFGDDVVLDDDEYFINPMMYLNFSIKYKDKDKYYGCRLIPADTISATNRDYCNRPTYDEPIITLFSMPFVDDTKVEADNLFTKDYLRLEIGENKQLEYLVIDYIKKPNQIKYSDNDADCVNCDLPAYVHPEIVQTAVTLFQQSIGAIAQQQV